MHTETETDFAVSALFACCHPTFWTLFKRLLILNSLTERWKHPIHGLNDVQPYTVFSVYPFIQSMKNGAPNSPDKWCSKQTYAYAYYTHLSVFRVTFLRNAINLAVGAGSSVPVMPPSLLRHDICSFVVVYPNYFTANVVSRPREVQKMRSFPNNVLFQENIQIKIPFFLQICEGFWRQRECEWRQVKRAFDPHLPFSFPLPLSCRESRCFGITWPQSGKLLRLGLAPRAPDHLHSSQRHVCNIRNFFC